MSPPEKTTPYDAIDATFLGALGIGSDPTSLPTSTVEVAFAGRSNVGKSSLINTLVQRKGLVRTSNTPGCTRQINFFSVRSRDDVAMTCVDLPGYGFARRSKSERSQWAGLIEGYLKRRPNLAALVLLVDARRGLEEDDLELLQFIAKGREKGLGPVQLLVAATKVDKLPKSQAVSSLAALKKQSALSVIGFSSVTRAGYVELWRAIRQSVGVQSSSDASTEASSTTQTPSETPRQV